ncbi:photosynthetic protein synthase I [Achromobacter piechaudii]|uniref:SCO family protein n=1 Tax=Achromobacter piechaudii TaxID=72556 RepID=UPI000682DE7C|nr:SCO family protein [Achromobacter piechaudii]KNY04200.1 photosynthetic protein synthase I [Achromobacter piechaudii]
MRFPTLFAPSGATPLHAPDPRRRLLLSSLALLALTGCGPAAPKLHGMDLSSMPTGDFQLQDTSGQMRTLADYRGHPVMLFFGFTQCPDICPTALTRALEIKALLGADADKLRVLFITVDPERDTPEILAAYTQAFDPGFVGLRGNAEQTRAAAQSFKVFYQKVPTGSSYTMDHTALTYLIDAQGKLRVALRHQQSAQECVEDLRTVL